MNGTRISSRRPCVATRARAGDGPDRAAFPVRFSGSRPPHLATLLPVLAAALLVSSRVGGEEAAPNAVAARKDTPIFDQRVDADGKPVYRIYPLRNGVCRVKGPYAFADNDDDSRDYGYALYIWLVLGGETPMLIDAGLEDVAHMNAGAAEVFSQPITQSSKETSKAQLRKFGLTPDDIGHVFVTHLHFDHVDEIFKYTNATFHIGRREWEGVTANGTRGSWCDGRVLFRLMEPEWRERIHLLDDGEILPGFEAFWVGGHTRGSMAYRVNTDHGRAVCTGDTVSLLANMDRPVGVAWNRDEVAAAVERIRELADIVLPSHDPATPERWPPVPEGTPRYSIRAIRVGECDVTNEITFQDAWGDDTGTRRYILYVWVIEGGPRPIVIDTGPNPRYVEEFNRSTAAYIPGGIRQTPEENTVIALQREGIDPDTVSHVIVTHCHADHYDYIDAFPHARVVINRRELESSRDGFPPAVRRALLARDGALLAVEEQEIVPGVRTVPLGCHTEGSQGVLVHTHAGAVMLAGDVVYMYDNIEQDRPGRSPNPQACRKSMARIRRLADLVLPAHDPLTLERWPEGVIGGKPGAR